MTELHKEGKAMKIDYYLKALVGGLVAALTALGGMLTAPEATLEGLSAGQWVAVALAFLGGLTAVYAAPNREREPDQTPVWVGRDEGDLDTYTTASGNRDPWDDPNVWGEG